MISGPPGGFVPPAPFIGPAHPDWEQLRLRPAIIIPFPTIAVDRVLLGGAGIIAGVVIRETAGAVASVDIYDGASAGGVLIAPVSLAAAGMFVVTLGGDGPYFQSGIFLNVLAGSIKGSFWVKYRA